MLGSKGNMVVLAGKSAPAVIVLGMTTRSSSSLDERALCALSLTNVKKFGVVVLEFKNDALKNSFKRALKYAVACSQGLIAKGLSVKIRHSHRWRGAGLGAS